jgi:predicted tellurium resistance membrane protein TerC
MDNVFTLGMLILLQGVLGFDNLLYISLESKRAPEESRKRVRQLGIGLAIVLRIALLFILMRVIQYFQEPLFDLHVEGFAFRPNIHAIIVLLGGAFIVYTATREVLHMMSLEDVDHDNQPSKSAGAVITSIVAMNLVFSFDSILSAMALSDVFWVMAVAIIVGGLLMIWLADRVTAFLHKNRMYEVLGLFILFVVGIMLVTEGGHLSHLSLFGNEVVPMTKTTFYFVIGILVLTDVVQGRYRRKLLRLKERKGPVATI